MKRNWKITTWNLDFAGNQYKIQFEFYKAFTHLLTAIYINGSELIIKKHFMFLLWKHEFKVEDHRCLLRIYFKTNFNFNLLRETDIYGNFIDKVPESDLYIDGSLIDPSSIFLPLRRKSKREE